MILPALQTFLREKRYRQLTITTLGVLILGILGYRLLEGWSWLECVNYAASIMVTSGNSEVYPQSDWGKVFNVFYMFLSVILILFFVNTLQQHFHESRQSNKEKYKRHQRIIKKKIQTQMREYQKKR